MRDAALPVWACGGRHPASECRAKRRMTEVKLRELGLPVPADPVEVGATRPAGAPSEAPAQKRRRILPPPLPIAPAGPMSSRPSAEELREAAAADRVVEVEDAEIGEVPASVDTRRPAEPAEIPGNFLEIPECLGLNPADSKWDRLATVRGKSAQTPSLIYNNVRGGALFLAGIPTAVTAAAFPACSLQVVCFPERLAQRQGVPLSGAHVEYFAIAHADRRQEDWDRVWPLVRRSLYHGDVVDHRPLHGGASPSRSCCGDVAGDAEGDQPGGCSGGDPEMPRCGNHQDPAGPQAGRMGAPGAGELLSRCV